MMTRGRGGSGYPPKVMTSFMNSPLYLPQILNFSLVSTLHDYYTNYQIQSGKLLWKTQTHLSWHWEKAGGRCPCKQRDPTRMLIIKSIERIENSPVFQPKIGMRS